MEIIQGLLGGLADTVTLTNLVFVLIGTVIGTCIGALPGVGPSATIAILLPAVFGMDPVSAMIMLGGIYMGAMYGGTFTAVLLNVPGESSSVMTAVEGYKLSLRGLAGKTLVISAIASFVGGMISITLLVVVAQPLARFALQFGPPEYFVLILAGLLSLSLLGSSSLPKVVLVAAIGLWLGSVGVDPMRGIQRFTFGLPFFIEGVSFIIVTVGMFGMGEVLSVAGAKERTPIKAPSYRSLYPSFKEIWEMRRPMLRGSGIGFLLGILPGAGANLASFMSYAMERKVSKTPEKFGTDEGMMEGVAAPEASNNASTGGALIPMFALGVPGSGVTAVMLAGMILLGLRPGPLLFEARPDFAWAVIASLYVSNLALLVLNWPMIPVFASVVRLKYSYLYPVILSFVLVGAYSVHYNLFGMWLVIAFGALGFAFMKLQLPAAPLVLALVLGPIFERSLVQSLSLSNGDPRIFIERPLSGAMLGLMVLMAVVPWLIRRLARKGDRAIQ